MNGHARAGNAWGISTTHPGGKSGDEGKGSRLTSAFRLCHASQLMVK